MSAARGAAYSAMAVSHTSGTVSAQLYRRPGRRASSWARKTFTVQRAAPPTPAADMRQAPARAGAAAGPSSGLRASEGHAAATAADGRTPPGLDRAAVVPPWEARAEQLSKPDMGEGLLQASIPWLPRLLAVPHDGGLDQWAAKATGVIPDSPFTDKERLALDNLEFKYVKRMQRVKEGEKVSTDAKTVLCVLPVMPPPLRLALALQQRVEVPYYGQYAHAASVFEGEALGRHKWNGAMATIHSPSSFSRIFKISESQAQWLQLAALQYALQWLEAGVAKPPAAVPLPPGVRQPHHERMEELNSAATRGLQEWVREARGLPTNRQADLKFWEGEAELLARFKGLVGSAPKDVKLWLELLPAMPPTLRAILALRFGLGDAYCSCGAAGGRTPFGDAVSSMLRDGVPKLRKQPPSVSKPLSFANMAQLLSKGAHRRLKTDQVHWLYVLALRYAVHWLESKQTAPPTQQTPGPHARRRVHVGTGSP